MSTLDRVTVLGGGPAGLATALRLRNLRLAEEITVLDKQHPTASAGWGISLDDAALAVLDGIDPMAGARVRTAMHGWDTVSLCRGDEEVTASGSRLAAVTRDVFLRVLRQRCQDVGVRLEHAAADPEAAREQVRSADLVVGADGVNSQVRTAFAEDFRPRVALGANHYVWLAAESDRLRPCVLLRTTPYGTMFASVYPFAPGRFTFIVECGGPVWERSGLARKSADESLAVLRSVFAEDLGDGRLLAGTAGWSRFATVHNDRWHTAGAKAVLVGDAAHTAHFSVGLGTRLAVEDAAELGSCLARHDDRETALRAYEAARRVPVEEGQARAAESQAWFERCERYRHFPISQLAFSWRARQPTTTFARLRGMDPAFTERVCRALGGGPPTDGGEPVSVPFDFPAVRPGTSCSPCRVPSRTVHVLDDELARDPRLLGEPGPQEPAFPAGLVLAGRALLDGVAALAGLDTRTARPVEVDLRPLLRRLSAAAGNTATAVDRASAAVAAASRRTGSPVILRLEAEAVDAGRSTLAGRLVLDFVRAVADRGARAAVHLVPGPGERGTGDADGPGEALRLGLGASDLLRNEYRCPTVVTGPWTRDAANTAIGAGRVDLVGVLRRPGDGAGAPGGVADAAGTPAARDMRRETRKDRVTR
ncbi:FAD-dependent monooxygenase [Streptomyces sp. NL15-2K]|uniref:FAD-dependent monooxygenase n=1 Tax=Streptomyces sp. NL15-2K TaxID=376149 RepID=UPI000F5825DE|nr:MULTISPECIES: FAD-dependent monooxygenase [Actinomycetes]WKX10510.1 FAD-dependent monooxygenase [Kutzneria buriramensis]GCB47956.1 old yellow enzyme family NADH:flavin oxidoreductases [Streptomyces sp. NL15-2K]